MWQFIGRIPLLALVPALLMFSGCWNWEVASQLIDDGSTGVQVAMFAVKHSRRSEQTQTPANEQREDAFEADHPGRSQLAEQASRPPASRKIQEPVLSTNSAVVTVAAAKGSGAIRQYDDELLPFRSRTRPVTTRKHRPNVVVLQRSPQPSILPHTTIVN